jgi:hypothetical protein
MKIIEALQKDLESNCLDLIENGYITANELQERDEQGSIQNFSFFLV